MSAYRKYQEVKLKKEHKDEEKAGIKKILS
jgi:hypothetical protein